MQKIAVLTSGGDAPGMNAAIRSVVRKGLSMNIEVYGIKRGFAGLFDPKPFTKLYMDSVADIIHRGGTILLTARAPEMLKPDNQDKAADRLKSEGIDGLIVIGGDGSYRGAMTLEQRGIQTIGIPGTIDNDINGSDLSIGFDTAVNTIIESVNRLRDTATSHERIFIVEVMGRESGHLALAVGLAGGAESLLVPEMPYDLNVICQRLMNGIASGKSHSIIILAEGAADINELNDKIRSRIQTDTRIAVLGHIQRGGSPNAIDRILGSRMGAAAVDLLLEGMSGVATVVRGEDVISKPLNQCVQYKKPFPKDLFDLVITLAR